MLCPKCHAELEPDARFCGACGSAIDERQQLPSQPHARNDPPTQAAIASVAAPRYVSTYKIGRQLAKFISFIGWLLVLGGSIGAFVSVSFLLSGKNLAELAFLPLSVSLLVAICGLLLAAHGQSIRAATEARALGYGGISVVARAVGLTRPTITAGMKELGDARQRVPMASKHRVRREGAGRPRLTDLSLIHISEPTRPY